MDKDSSTSDIIDKIENDVYKALCSTEIRNSKESRELVKQKVCKIMSELARLEGYGVEHCIEIEDLTEEERNQRILKFKLVPKEQKNG